MTRVVNGCRHVRVPPAVKNQRGQADADGDGEKLYRHRIRFPDGLPRRTGRDLIRDGGWAEMKTHGK